MTGERYRLYNGGRRLDFVNQPGFRERTTVSGVNVFDSIYFYASNGGQNHNGWFFDLDGGMPAGEGVSVSENETVSVLAGTFGDCLHIRFDTKEAWGSDVVYEIWYAKDVGLVKFRANMDYRPEEVYELCEYKLNGGTGYMPAAVGNTWRYQNSNLSEMYQQINEYEITAVMDDPETKSQYIYAAAVQIVRSSKENCDSDTHIALAQEALPHEKPKQWDFETAIAQLKLANQKNTSVRASLFARHALAFQKRCAGYAQNRWVFLPSGVYGGIVSKDKASGQILYRENDVYSMGPYVSWGPWYGARRCIGLKPFRFLHLLAGTLYSEKWVDGYAETIPSEDGDVHLAVEDGGTVITKAGTFEGCLKVTFRLGWEGGKGDEAYYLRNLRYSHCGTKVFWFVPNVGIVKHDCIWDSALMSSIELTEYNSCATNGEYMPIYVGSRWVYDEVTLPAEFIARKTYDIASGMEDEFFLIEEQEMLFQGTEDEYGAFQKTREK